MKFPRSSIRHVYEPVLHDALLAAVRQSSASLLLTIFSPQFASEGMSTVHLLTNTRGKLLSFFRPFSAMVSGKVDVVMLILTESYPPQIICFQCLFYIKFNCTHLLPRNEESVGVRDCVSSKHL